MAESLPCSRCGNPAWEPNDDAPDDETVARRTRPLALESGLPLCHRCWSIEWDSVATSYTNQRRTEPRGSFLIEEVIPFDAIIEEEYVALSPPPKFNEFTCPACLTLRSVQQRTESGSCVDCVDMGVQGSGSNRRVVAKPTRRYCPVCFERFVAEGNLICTPCASGRSS